MREPPPGRGARDVRRLAEALLPNARFAPELRGEGALARPDVVETRPSGRAGIVALCDAVRPGESVLDRLAFWLAVARQAGLDVESAAVLHLNADFVRNAGEPEPRAVLARATVTREVEFLARDVPARIAAQREVLARAVEPAIEPSPHCRRPEPCPFLARCTAAKPDDWIGFLPGLRQPESDALREAGVERIGDIPADRPLTPAQANARASCQRGGVYAAPDLARRLEGFGPPADALDFEAILPEVPIFAGLRSLAIGADEDRLVQQEALAAHDLEPRLQDVVHRHDLRPAELE